MATQTEMVTETAGKTAAENELSWDEFLKQYGELLNGLFIRETEVCQNGDPLTLNTDILACEPGGPIHFAQIDLWDIQHLDREGNSVIFTMNFGKMEDKNTVLVNVRNVHICTSNNLIDLWRRVNTYWKVVDMRGDRSVKDAMAKLPSCTTIYGQPPTPPMFTPPSCTPPPAAEAEITPDDSFLHCTNLSSEQAIKNKEILTKRGLSVYEVFPSDEDMGDELDAYSRFYRLDLKVISLEYTDLLLNWEVRGILQGEWSAYTGLCSECHEARSKHVTQLLDAIRNDPDNNPSFGHGRNDRIFMGVEELAALTAEDCKAPLGKEVFVFDGDLSVEDVLKKLKKKAERTTERKRKRDE
tara:strand:- start:275 stop:1339 length:1065 start_codon:yes stop_codon:yes gene_type:complete